MNSIHSSGRRHKDHKKRRHYEREDETRSRRDDSKGKRSHKIHKDKKEKRKQKREQRGAESSDSEVDLLTSLEKEKVAVRALRQILLHQYSLRSDVREVRTLCFNFCITAPVLVCCFCGGMVDWVGK